MNKIILKILIIISILIIIFGIISAIGTKNQLINAGMPTEKQYVDGTDMTAFVDAFAQVGAGLMAIIIIMYSVLIVGGIWIVYGIVYLIIKIINKCKQNKKLHNL